MDWLQKHIKKVDDFPRPDWEAIHNYVEKEYKNHDQQDVWCDIARVWIENLKAELPDNYATHESDNFILVTSRSDRYVSSFQKFLEHALKKNIKCFTWYCIR